MAQQHDPSLFRRRLRSELRRLRETQNLSQREAAQAMDWSLSKLIRIETGAVTITTNDLRAVLSYYAVTDPEKVTSLVETARRSRERSMWWTAHRDVASNELLAMCGYEASAKAIRNFEPLLVPGLLQTEEYARDLFKYLRGAKDPKRIDGLVRLRMQRQELLLDEDGPKSIHFLMDESVVQRVVGGPSVMRKQLQRIQQVSELEHVAVGIVPFSRGMFRGLRVPYMLFEFDDSQDQSILYLENPEGESIIYEDEGVTMEDEGVPTPTVYLELFWELEHAVDPEQTQSILADALSRLPS
jgi:transcriptional regulator with XRE-family HTH domain